MRAALLSGLVGLVGLAGLVALGAAGCGDTPAADPSLALLGGDTTIFDDTDEAFAYPARNGSSELRAAFQLGDGLFNRNWVTAPATPQGNDGLGPTFNAISCSGCHPNGGSAAPPTPGDSLPGLLVRLSLPGTDAHGGPRPDPNYGDQLNDHAILGVPAEGAVTVSYTEEPGHYDDGEAYSLRRPSYAISALAFGPLGDGIQLSPRVGPRTIGLGLLAAVPVATLQELAAANGGHLNHAWNVKTQQLEVGRFGWKANQPTLEQQTMSAFLGDIGLTTALLPAKNCPPAQTACANAPPSLSQPNVSELKATAMTVHSHVVAVPARRHLDDRDALEGEQLFAQLGCAACHVPKMVTGTLDGYPELSNQTIRPFTDLLLHDLGDGLADGRPDFEAGGSEWRTTPLWGIGLSEAVSDHTFFLHDGRARGLAEAILWHGGQAAQARDAFRALSKSDRAALLAFLQSL